MGLTQNAVGTMVKGEKLEQALTVQIFPVGPLEAVVFDGKDQVKALMLAPEYDGTQSAAIIANITGYVSSGGNAYSGEAILCITSLEVVMSKQGRSSKLLRQTTPSFQLNAGRVQGGIAPKFLSKTAPFLTNEQLAGCQAHDMSETDRTSRKAKLHVVADFLSQHAAMKTLHNRNAGESTAIHSTSTKSQTDIYMTVLEEFQKSQLDRQKATLVSNAGRESAAVSTQIVNQHQAALYLALQDAESCNLSLDKLKTWHGMVCGNGLVQDAGKLRKKSVRVGLTAFAKHDTVEASLNQFCQAIQILYSRLIQHAKDGDDKAVSAITFAAAVFIGTVDIHAFSDGNGRLARIATNWALRKAGFPFCVALHATSTQRAEYSRAIRQTRKNTDLLSCGNVPDELLLTAHQKVGALRPIVDLLLDRIHKSITEFNKSLTEKQSLHDEEAEARAARKFRERAALGSCLICFESNPNIATLCCGKAVHLNCVAVWLSGKNSCPNCRAALPSIPESMRAPAPSSDNEETNTTSIEDSDTYSTTEEQHDIDDTTTFMDDDDDTTSLEQQQPPPPPPPPPPPVVAQDDGDTTMDDDTSSDYQSTSLHDTTAAADSDDNTMDDDDDTTTNAATPAPQPAVLYCNLCNNRAARDCSNTMCGRCCMIHGAYRCARHT